MSTATTVSTADVADGNLPADATGVRWTDTAWTECRAHLEDPSWRTAVDRTDEPTGVVLTAPVTCDACRADR